MRRAQVELDEEEDEDGWDTEIQVKASSMKVWVMEVKEPSPKREEEPISNLSMK